MWRLNKGSKQERWKKMVSIVHTNYPLPIPYFRWREKPCLWNRRVKSWTPFMIQDPKYSLSGQVGMPPSLRRRFTDSKKTFETQKNLPRCKKIAVINLYHCFPPVSFFTPLIPQIPSRQFTWLQRVYPNVNKETWKRSQIKFYYIADSACGQ